MISISDSASMSQEPNVKNWREIDLSTITGLRALNRLIAEYLGYAAKQTERGWQIFDPQDKALTFSFHDKNHAWNTALTWHIPNYSNEPAAALIIADTWLRVEAGKGKDDEQIWRANVGLDDDTWEHADTFPLAICKAFMAYEDWSETVWERAEKLMSGNGGAA